MSMMEQFMVWYVLDSIVSPDSDTAFSLISSPCNLKFVLWYDTEHYLSPGDSLETSDNGLIVNGHVQPVYILDVSIFRSDYWKKLRVYGNDSNLLIVFYVQIMPDDFIMQLHRF